MSTIAMKMEINRLEKEELVYELAFRGFKDKQTVNDMRKTLRNILRLEKAGSKMTYPKYPFKFEDDYTYLVTKIAEIEGLVNDFSDSDTSPQFLKILSKISHSFDRANRAEPTSDGDSCKRSQLLISILNAHSSLNQRVRRFKRLSHSSIPLGLATTDSPEGSTSENDSSEEDAPMASTPNCSAAAASVDRLQSIPVFKWNLKYDGSSMSLTAFLENVDELKISRNVSQTQLRASASDLFIGKAKIWYNSIKDQVHSWDDLVAALKKQFLPSDYNDRLFDEIKQRTQGPHEPIGLYIATMINLFNRLNCTLSSSVKLKILLKNIAPFYQSQLGLIQIQSIEHLLELGRQLEERKESIESFVPPPRNRKLMEPDLAYVYVDNTSASAGPSSSINCNAVSSSQLSCWNCKSPGHRARECEKPRTKYCFRCGNSGHTVKSCPKCSQRSGNEPRRY